MTPNNDPTVEQFEAALKEYGAQCSAWAKNENADAKALYAAHQRLIELFTRRGA